MIQSSRKSSIFSLSNSKAFLIIGVLITFFMSVNLVKAIQENRQVQQGIDKLQLQLSDLNKQNQNLNTTLDYTKTDLFVEEEARNRLNLKKTDEIVVSLPPDKVAIREQSSAEYKAIQDRSQQPNPRKWFDYFFAGSTNSSSSTTN